MMCFNTAQHQLWTGVAIGQLGNRSIAVWPCDPFATGNGFSHFSASANERNPMVPSRPFALVASGGQDGQRRTGSPGHDGMKRCLILYYSFTGQAARAAAVAAEAACAEGWDPLLCRIDMAEPGERLARPFRIADSKKWTTGAQQGMTRPLVFTPADALGGNHDAVLLFTNTWGDNPSVPVRSFLASPDAHKVLAERPFGVFVVCRRLWKKNLATVRTMGEAAGGHFVDGEAFTHSGGQIGSLIQTVTYLFRGDGGRRRFLGFPLPPYGLSNNALARVPLFTRELLARMGDDQHLSH